MDGMTRSAGQLAGSNGFEERGVDRPLGVWRPVDRWVPPARPVREDRIVVPVDEAMVARIDRLLQASQQGAPGVEAFEMASVVSTLLWSERGATQAPPAFDALFAALRAKRRGAGPASGRGLHRWVLAVLQGTSDLQVHGALRPAAVGLLANTRVWIDEALAGGLSSHRLRLTWLRASVQRKLLHHQALTAR
jgi:hypothetical protein